MAHGGGARQGSAADELRLDCGWLSLVVAGTRRSHLFFVHLLSYSLLFKLPKAAAPKIEIAMKAHSSRKLKEAEMHDYNSLFKN